jgi:hypothetical protein
VRRVAAKEANGDTRRELITPGGVLLELGPGVLWQVSTLLRAYCEPAAVPLVTGLRRLGDEARSPRIRFAKPIRAGEGGVSNPGEACD